MGKEIPALRVLIIIVEDSTVASTSDTESDVGPPGPEWDDWNRARPGDSSGFKTVPKGGGPPRGINRS
jgi:hypothetical protein